MPVERRSVCGIHRWCAVKRTPTGGSWKRFVSLAGILESDDATYRVEKYKEVVGTESVGDDEDEQVRAIETGYETYQVSIQFCN